MSASHSIGMSVSFSIGLSVCLLVCHSISHLVCHLVSHLVRWPGRHTNLHVCHSWSNSYVCLSFDSNNWQTEFRAYFIHMAGFWSHWYVCKSFVELVCLSVDKNHMSVFWSYWYSCQSFVQICISVSLLIKFLCLSVFWSNLSVYQSFDWYVSHSIDMSVIQLTCLSFN